MQPWRRCRRSDQTIVVPKVGMVRMSSSSQRIATLQRTPYIFVGRQRRKRHIHGRKDLILAFSTLEQLNVQIRHRFGQVAVGIFLVEKGTCQPQSVQLQPPTSHSKEKSSPKKTDCFSGTFPGVRAILTPFSDSTHETLALLTVMSLTSATDTIRLKETEMAGVRSEAAGRAQKRKQPRAIPKQLTRLLAVLQRFPNGSC